MAYATIDIEGGFFPSDLIERIGEGDTDIEGQRAADFRLPRNRSLTEEIQRAFSDSRVYWDAFNRRLNRSQESRTTLTRQDWAAKFFELLGFPPLKYQRAAVEAGGSQFIISHRVGGGENAVPIHIVTLDQGLDDRGTRNRRSPHTQVQDFLNRSEALWGVTTNGTHLRLLRDSARLSKPTYLEFDLRAMIDGNDYREFVVLYRLMHSTRFPLGEIEPHECLLENYYNQGIEEGGRVREKLRHGVKSALEVLGRALVSHPGNGTLRRALRGGTLDETGYYRQLLNFVYRMLFLMVAEERKLLFIEPSTGQTIYDRYYSVTRLRERAEHYFAGDNHGDLWAGLAETFRLCRDEAAARHLNLSPLNGELFGEQACSRIETAHCSNETLLTVMRSLSTFHDGGVRRRVNYAALDVEEFGSVYESLLDYRPVLDVGEVSGSPPSFDLAAGTQRKETGSYYTPPELVRELVDSALVPVMEERLAAADTRIKKVQALLDLRVCDPASGSGHFLLAAARRIARELAKIRAGGEEPSPLDYRRALRTVVRHCIYAVDKNPLAVDLCKVALWIECHTVGLPLGFLDHHVKCGDSLVGVMDLDVLKEGIPDAAYKPVTGDDKEAAKWYRKRNKKERTGQQRLTSEPPPLDTQKMADDFANFGRRAERSAADVKKMEKEYRELQNSEVLRRFKVACDLWTYAFFAPRESFETEEHDRVPTTDDIRRARNGQNTGSQLEDRAHQASRDYPYFHWPLEFPDVCFKDGGFDVVLGNPPWDQVQLDPREFFATSDPDVANQPNMAARNRAIQRLASTNPGLYLEYQVAVREMKATQKFIHSSGRFPKTSYGRLNYAPLFAEHSKDLQHPRGKAGIIVPTGIATDSFNQYFFADLIDHRALVSLYDFENKRKVFPGIDGRLKFCLLTLSGIDRPSAQGEFAFFLHHTEQLQDSERRFFLSSEDFALFNPNTRTCPLFRTQKDMEIARKMYQYAGVFWRELSDDQPESNPWGVKFQLMFMMNTASYLFRTHQQLTEDGWELRGNIFIRGEELYLPLYEAKLFHQYDHRFATFAESSPKDLLKGNAQTIPSNEKANPHTLPLPRYWVPENEVMTKLNKAVTGHTTTIGSDRIGSDRIGSDRIGSDRIGSDRIGSDRIGSDRIGSDRGQGTDATSPHPTGAHLNIRRIASSTNLRTGIAAMIPLLGIGESGITIIIGSLPSEISQMQPINEPLSSRP